MRPHLRAAMLLIDVLMGEAAQRLMSREQYYRVNSAASPLDTMSLFYPVRQNRKVLMVDDDLLSQEKARSMALFQQYFRRDLTQHLADSGVSR